MDGRRVARMDGESALEEENGGKDKELCRKTCRWRLELSMIVTHRKNVTTQVWIVKMLRHYDSACRDSEQVEEDK